MAMDDGTPTRVSVTNLAPFWGVTPPLRVMTEIGDSSSRIRINRLCSNWNVREFGERVLLYCDDESHFGM